MTTAAETLERGPLKASIAQDRLLTIEHAAPEAWDSTIADFDDVCPEQTYTFAQLRWPKLRREPLIFRQGNDVVGGALMMVQRLPLGLGSVAIGKWAPMFRNARRSDRMAAYESMIATLIADYAQGRNMMLALLPRALPDRRDDEFNSLRQRGFIVGTNVPFPERYIVDLSFAEDEHRRRLNGKWRYHLNHADKAGLTFEVAGPDALPAFAALYNAMSHRKKFPDYSAYETVPSLVAMPDASLRPRLFFVRHDGKIIAGALIFSAGDTAIYLYGATSDEALPLRAGYFMHWQIVCWLKAHTRARWYDLGGSDGFHGLHQFKKGMVGKAGAIVPLPPMLHFATRRLPLILGTSAFAVRDALLNLRHRLSVRSSDLAKPDLVRRDVS
jgi:hypothetical protein